MLFFVTIYTRYCNDIVTFYLYCTEIYSIYMTFFINIYYIKYFINITFVLIDIRVVNAGNPYGKLCKQETRHWRVSCILT